MSAISILFRNKSLYVMLLRNFSAEKDKIVIIVTTECYL
jgi:hypothetical protein